MPDLDPLATLRHDLANPLSALLAEAQLALMIEEMDEQTRRSLQEIEKLAIRMRSVLREGR